MEQWDVHPNISFFFISSSTSSISILRKQKQVCPIPLTDYSEFSYSLTTTN